MTERDISIESLVRLPRMNAHETVTLGEQLVTAAQAELDAMVLVGQTIPVAINRPLLRMQTALVLLKQEILPQQEGNPKAAKAANRVLDGAWRVFFDWMGAMARAPVSAIPEAPKMAELKRSVFKDGLEFTTFTFKEEWSHSDARLRAMSDFGYESVIDDLGGTPLLHHVKEAQSAFGKVLGIETPLAKVESPEIRSNLDTLVSAMKTYVVKVVAHPDPDVAGSQALCDALLYPLVHWGAPRSGGDDASDGEADDAGEADDSAASPGASS